MAGHDENCCCEYCSKIRAEAFLGLIFVWFVILGGWAYLTLTYGFGGFLIGLVVFLILRLIRRLNIARINARNRRREETERQVISRRQ